MLSIFNSLVIVFACGIASITQHKLRLASWFSPHKKFNGIFFKLSPTVVQYARNDTATRQLQEVKPYHFPPLKERTSNGMVMGLKRLEASNWLTHDANYIHEHSLRLHYLSHNRPQVIQILPGSEAACHELLTTVATFLSSRFPTDYKKFDSFSGPMIQNYLTGEVFPCGSNASEPLEIAAKLAMEDFNLLFKNEKTQEYELLASATLFPAGWKLQERIGTSLANLHAPVPGWQTKLGAHVNRYFDHLQPRTAMERASFFIQCSPDLFQDAPEQIPEGKSTPVISAQQIMIRRERQTFTRLPESKAICFTVRTFMYPMTELSKQELRALRSQVLGWEEEVRIYKGWSVWGPTVMDWCNDKLGVDEMQEK